MGTYLLTHYRSRRGVFMRKRSLKGGRKGKGFPFRPPFGTPF
jgi:hypothetical protein